MLTTASQAYYSRQSSLRASCHGGCRESSRTERWAVCAVQRLPRRPLRLAPQPLPTPPKPPHIDKGWHVCPHDAEGEDRANNGHEPGTSSFSASPVVGSDSADQGGDNRYLQALEGAFDRLAVPPLLICHVPVTAMVPLCEEAPPTPPAASRATTWSPIRCPSRSSVSAPSRSCRRLLATRARRSG